ncbi:MAG: phosphomannomutase/phosphoglucomutase [Pseudomonadales bacterium]|nr:phosphomannomutase/phosphoglucomutase [Pseudomonadales bacterium]
MNNRSELIVFSKTQLIFIVAGFLLCTLASVFFLQPAINSDYQAHLGNVVANNLQLRVNQRQDQLLAQANRVATSTRLSELVSNGDVTQRALEEARLRETIPHAVRVRLIGLKEATVEREAIPPFTFTSLDLVNRVETGENVFPEAAKANGRWLISVAAPIKSPPDPRVTGTLFFYLEITALSDIFGDELQGEVTIHQTFRNTEPSAIFSQGSGGFSLVLERPLDNPNWHVSYKPNVELMDQPTSHALLYLAPGLLFLLIATIGVLVGARKSLSLVEADSALLQRQMDDVSTGPGETRARYGLHAFLELDASLTKLGQKITVSVAVTPPDINLGALTCEQDTASDSNVEMTNEMPVVEHEGSLVEEITDSEYFDTECGESTADELETIFRAYDIRGILNQTLTTEVIRKIGQAIGSEAKELGEQTLVVGADGRISSPTVMDTLINGILTTGTNVHSIGAVPTPLVYFATNTLETESGIAVTGSHNPADYNGFKIVLKGRTLVSEDIQKLYKRVLNEDFRSGEGQLTESDIRDDYIDAIADDVIVAQPLKVVIDCGNGIAGDIAPDLLSALGCEVLPLYCEVDGSFPNHHPDPTIPANLEDLIITIRSNDADLGIALDGDGDRIVAITGDGEIVWPDQLLMLFAKDVVSRSPGSDVVYDVKCTRHLNSVISGFGGRPIICRSGHSYLKEKIQETGAVLGGELSGHVCFNERWYGFDDGLYAAARLLEIVGAQPKSLKHLMSEFPVSVSTPEIQMFVSETEKFDIIRNFNQLADFEGGTLNNIDGTRVDFSDGWGLIRASNTNPCLTLRFEANDAKSLERIKNDFRQKLKLVDESLGF